MVIVAEDGYWLSKIMEKLNNSNLFKMDNRQRMSGNQPGKTESTMEQDRLDQVAGKRKEEKSW